MLYLFKLYHRQLSASSVLSRERKATRKRTYGVLSPRGIVSVLCFRCEVEVFSSEFRHLTKHQVFNSSSKLLLSTYSIAFSALSLFSLSNFLKFCTFCLCNFKEKDLLKKWSKTRTFWLIQLRRNMPFLQTDGWDPSTSYWKTGNLLHWRFKAFIAWREKSEFFCDPPFSRRSFSLRLRVRNLVKQSSHKKI